MIKERNSENPKETTRRLVEAKYQLSVGGQIFKDLTEEEVRAKLLEIDPDGKMTVADYRVKET